MNLNPSDLRYRTKESFFRVFFSIIFSESSSKFVPKGGSRKTISNNSSLFIKNLKASLLITFTFKHVNNLLFSLISLQMTGLLSTNTQLLAPLETHSKPMAPVPANRSRQFLPKIKFCNQLNTVSRVLDPVGLTPGWSSTFQSSTFESPANYLISLSLILYSYCCSAHHYDCKVFCHSSLKCITNICDRYLLHFARKCI